MTFFTIFKRRTQCPFCFSAINRYTLFALSCCAEIGLKRKTQNMSRQWKGRRSKANPHPNSRARVSFSFSRISGPVLLNGQTGCNRLSEAHSSFPGYPASSWDRSRNPTRVFSPRPAHPLGLWKGFPSLNSLKGSERCKGASFPRQRFLVATGLTSARRSNHLARVQGWQSLRKSPMTPEYQ